MMTEPLAEIPYFPGCSLATTARENNASLKEFCRRMRVRLVELDDWNCCGSSSAHSVNGNLAMGLAARNLSLAPEKKPLLAACPSCLLRLRQTHLYYKTDEKRRKIYEKTWGRSFDERLVIIHFFDLLADMGVKRLLRAAEKRLNGLRFAPYYGCMLAHPPELKHEKNYYGFMEKILSALDAVPTPWNQASKCCGTFLSAARPDVVTPIVNRIIAEAVNAQADCIVTACAMCHMNLEIRCTLKEQLPIFHFSELLALAMGQGKNQNWFSRHLTDPAPLLRIKRLMQ